MIIVINDMLSSCRICTDCSTKDVQKPDGSACGHTKQRLEQLHAGKSSAINTFTDQKSLARTSKTFRARNTVEAAILASKADIRRG